MLIKLANKHRKRDAAIGATLGAAPAALGYLGLMKLTKAINGQSWKSMIQEVAPHALPAIAIGGGIGGYMGYTDKQ